MNNKFLEIINKHQAINEFINNTSKYFISDDVIGVSFLVASAFTKKKGKYLIVTSSLYKAQRITDIITNLLDTEKCYLFPVDEMLQEEIIARSKEMTVQRLYVLNQIMTSNEYIVVTHSLGLMKHMPSPKLFATSCVKLTVGQQISLNYLKEKLTEIGYKSVHKLDHSLQFASRGDILDVASVNREDPIRIEFFDDTIESIRVFSLNTQTSYEELECVEILPASEYLFTDIEKSKIKNKLDELLVNQKIQLNTNKSNWHISLSTICEDILTDSQSNYMESFYGYLKDEQFTLLDYCPDARIIIANEALVNENVKNIKKLEEAHISSDFGLINFLPFNIYVNINELLEKKKTTVINEFKHNLDNEIVFPIRSINASVYSMAQAIELIKSYISVVDKLILCLENMQQIGIIQAALEENSIEFELLDSLDIPHCKIGIALIPLDEGFEIIDENIAFLSSHELFSFKTKSSRFVNRYKEAVVLKSEQDLIPGDYIVHEQHGVGKFLDITTMEFDGVHRDFLHIQYAGTDVLYIPLEQFHLLRKFVGKEGAIPKLNKLGSGEWEKTKTKIKERLKEMTDRLFNLYQERENTVGFAFKKDDEFQEEFERQFPYVLTKDQETSIKEIKHDMESPRPMDRLLCGDVGFGKTEVAFRAAFKAILSGKQVAILCPTTLLARQHYERALERFNAFDVRIAIFSRLIDEKKEKMFRKQVEDGTAHLIIGTHSILSNSMHFNNLGLLIVDEEQRFGVLQKEKIKELKKNIDVLTLTATPIPRTLQMSLVGIRPLSQINTPPSNRIPIQTYVMPQKDELIYELIQRELARNGQIFYLHNNIATIYAIALKIEKKIKGVRVGIAHAKMDKEKIEDVMMSFYRGEIDVLVCTSIIETGIDIPNVNMIIIENADQFGLAQLYQIKGRVGRGDRIAYAYLLYKPNKQLTDVARKRLKAISDFTELGSGYKIAQRDLIIRGAGDILGAEQAGFIDTVGIDMYLQLLKETIEEKKTGKIKKTENDKGNITVDGYLPSEYIDVKDKIDIYQEIDGINSIEELQILKNKIRDIYGRLPESVNTLFLKKEVLFKIKNNVIFANITEQKAYVDLILSEEFSRQNGIGVKLFNALLPYIKYLKVTYTNHTIRLRILKPEKWLKLLNDIVNATIKLDKNNKTASVSE